MGEKSIPKWQNKGINALNAFYRTYTTDMLVISYRVYQKYKNVNSLDDYLNAHKIESALYYEEKKARKNLK